MPDFLSKMFKAGAAALPLLAGSPAILAKDIKDLSPTFTKAINPLDVSLLAEARKYLFADMGTIYNVTPETLAKFTYDVYDKDFMEQSVSDHQKGWQKQILGNAPEKLAPALIERMKTDDVFLAETLIKATKELPMEENAFLSLYRKGETIPLSPRDKVSHLVGQMIDRGDINDTGRKPYRFFNQSDTDSLTVKTPYKTITPDQLARFKTLEDGEESPVILMLPPTASPEKDYADIDYENKAQWQAGHDILTGLGAKIIVLDAEEMRGGIRGNDSVEHFVRDQSLVFPDSRIAFIPWRNVNTGMRADEQTSERPMFLYEHMTAPYTKALKDKGYELVPLDSGTLGGDFLTHPQKKLAFMADNGEQNMSEQIRIMSEKTGYEILAVPKLRNSTFYHLDTFMMTLPKGEVMIYPNATTEDFMNKLEQKVGANNIIHLSEEDARLMATNMMMVGRTLVMPGASEALIKQLERRDYKAVTPTMFSENNASLYGYQHGYLHCQTQELR